MFLDQLEKDQVDKARADFQSWLSNFTDLEHSMGVQVGEQEVAKTPSSFLDCYPQLGLESYSDFGSIYVRVWSIGTPRRFMYGIYLGAKVSKAQEEIRRGVDYARVKLQPVLSELEGSAKKGFKYHQWTDRLAPWLGTAGSKRAVVRQFDHFITFKMSDDKAEVLEDLETLIKAVDKAVDLISPVPEFAKEIVNRFFVASGLSLFNLGTAESASEPGTVYKPELEVEWSSAKTVPAELFKGHEAAFLQAVSALKAGKHVVFSGPPGTGKTELAVRICETLNVPYDLTTATSDWTTFDTIGGYLPDPKLLTDKVHTEPLNFFPGVVTKSLERKRWLVIDEVNRADVDKAFGELFTLLTGKSVRLPYTTRSGDSLKDVVLGQLKQPEEGVHSISVPDSWRIIGTMNTFDKASLFQLSYAFMRRFAFVEVPIPDRDDFQAILEHAADHILAEDLGEEVTEKVLGFMTAVFAPQEGEGLAGFDLLVGPAIPLDVLKYIHERVAAAGEVQLDNIWKFVLEALEIYLYPQFEGRDRKHTLILKAVTDALKLPPTAQAKTNKLLASWTGFDGRGLGK